MSMMSTYTKGYTNIVFPNVSNQLDFFTNIIITLCMLWLSYQYNIETKNAYIVVSSLIAKTDIL